MATPTKETVNHPVHYNSHPSGIEAIDLIEDLPSNISNAVKYLYRRDHKSDDPCEDLKKAMWYTRREIERREKAGYVPCVVNTAALDPLAELFERVFDHESVLMTRTLGALYHSALFPANVALLRRAASGIEAEIKRVTPKRGPLPTDAPAASEPAQEEPVPDPEVVALASLIKVERFHCKVCHKAGSVSRTPNGPFSVTCTTCGVNVSADERGLAFERWTTMIAKQNPTPIGERVANAQLREDALETPNRASH